MKMGEVAALGFGMGHLGTAELLLLVVVLIRMVLPLIIGVLLIKVCNFHTVHKACYNLLNC